MPDASHALLAIARVSMALALLMIGLLLWLYSQWQDTRVVTMRGQSRKRTNQLPKRRQRPRRFPGLFRREVSERHPHAALECKTPLRSAAGVGQFRLDRGMYRASPDGTFALN